MANLVFTPCTGAVAVSRLQCSQSDFLNLKIDGTNFSGNYVLTGVTLEMSGNYQFLHTVNDFVYFYAFGDRVGLLTANGVGFIKTCPGTSQNAQILSVYEYYMNNRTAARGKKSLLITLSTSQKSVTLYGFLTGVKLDVNDSNFGPIGYWSMRFEVLPQKITNNSGGGGGGRTYSGPGSGAVQFV